MDCWFNAVGAMQLVVSCWLVIIPAEVRLIERRSKFRAGQVKQPSWRREEMQIERKEEEEQGEASRAREGNWWRRRPSNWFVWRQHINIHASRWNNINSGQSRGLPA